MSRPADSTFPKARVDALSDGVFAFAMTLLVLNISLPDDLEIATSGALIAHLGGLWHPALTYLISFLVLGAFWRSGVALRPSSEVVSAGVVQLGLLLLFFVTLVPFSSGLVGRFGVFAPAVLAYAANMVALAAVSIAIRYFDVPPERRSLLAAAGPKLPLFLVSVALSVFIAFVAPRYAMFAYLLNGAPRLPGWPSRGYGGEG